MSWQILKQRIAYHYKKYIAVVCAVIAILLMLTNFGMELAYIVVNSSTSVVSLVLTLWNLVVYLIAYFLILVGNLQGSYNAYTGMLCYIFMFIFDAAQLLFFSSESGIASWFSGSAVVMVMALLYFLFAVAALTTGIMTYIRTREFITSRYASYEGLRNWCLAFVICSILMNATGPIFEGFAGLWSWSTASLYLLPISEVFISISIYFTVLRLKSEY